MEIISIIQITFHHTCVHTGERFFFKKNLFLTCERTSNRQKLSSTGFIKGEALRLLRTNSSKTTFEENITLFKQRLRYRGYRDNLIDKTLSEVNFSERMSALQNKQKTRKNILPFVTEYRPSVPNLKTIQMSKWHLIENQPLLREIYKDPSPLSYRKREIFERRTRNSKLALKVIFFLSRPIGAVFGLSSLFYHSNSGHYKEEFECSFHSRKHWLRVT